MITIIWAMLRRAPHFFIASILAVAAGTALLTFTQVGSTSAIVSAENRIDIAGVGYAVTVAKTNPHTRITDEVLRTIAESDGVTAVDAQYKTMAVGGPESTEVGLYSTPGPQSRPAPEQGGWPKPGEATINQKAVSQWDVSVGDVITLSDDSSPVSHRVRVVGVVDPVGHAAAGDSTPVAFIDPQDFAVLFPRLLPASVGVTTTTAPQTIQSLNSRLTDDFVVRNRAAMVTEALAVRQAGNSMITSVLGALSIACLLSAFTVIATSLTYAIVARRRQYALLRTIGAKRRQIFWSAITEAFCVGVIGALTGCLVGVTATWLAIINPVVADPFNADALHIRAQNILFPMCFGIAVSVLSAIGPAWTARKVIPNEAIGTHTQPAARRVVSEVRRSLRWGSAFFGAFLLWGVYTNAFGEIFSFLLTPVGVLFLLPVLRSTIADLIRGLGSALSGTRLLNHATIFTAMQNMLSSARSSAGTIVGLALSIATIIAITTASATYTNFAKADAQAKFPFSTVGVAAEPLTDAQLDVLRKPESIQSVVVLGTLNATLGERPARTITSVPKDAAEALFTSTDSAAIRDGVLYVSPSLYMPQDRDGKYQDQTLRGATGSATLQVVADPRVPDALGYLLTSNTAQRLGTEQLTVVVAQSKGSTHTNTELARQPGWSELVVRPAFAEADSFLVELATVVSISRAVIVVGFVVALVGVANALFIAVRQRRRTIALTRALGLSADRCRNALILEALIMAGLAVLVALPLGAAVGVGLARALVGMEIVPGHDPMSTLAVVLDVPTTVTLTVGAMACSVAAGLWPALRVMRISPGQGLTS